MEMYVPITLVLTVVGLKHLMQCEKSSKRAEIKTMNLASCALPIDASLYNKNIIACNHDNSIMESQYLNT
jgi:hypothetical protein